MIKLRENHVRLSQARFQQKQLQEKEQKLLQLYDQQQQRAYQVVHRGSAGSNGSNHATSISQHTVTKTSSSSHTTSTSQGGKVSDSSRGCHNAVSRHAFLNGLMAAVPRITRITANRIERFFLRESTACLPFPLAFIPLLPRHRFLFLISL